MLFSSQLTSNILQPKLEKISSNLSSSIAVKREIAPYMDYPLHYHPEYEIIFVERSYGIRLMGNHIGNFSDGDLMFISPNLPHVWKNDKEFYQGNNTLQVDVYVIHFGEDALTEGFFDLPEFTQIKKLFLLGQQGLLLRGKDHKKISELIKAVYSSSGIERLILFFKTLETIANTSDYELLSSMGYANTITTADTERINKVMSFIMANYTQEINLEELSGLVSLNKSSFCRYFKSRTHKTCSQVINEIRIAHACKLLLNKNMTISEICYETGYNNISHFNRQFKLITSVSPSAYADKYLGNAG
jgi:AraC-like DNA-binding protein